MRDHDREYRARKKMQAYDEPHAILHVNKVAEQRCGTCKHCRAMATYHDASEHKGSIPSVSCTPYCSLRPTTKTKCGYKGVKRDTQVCDLWEQ